MGCHSWPPPCTEWLTRHVRRQDTRPATKGLRARGRALRPEAFVEVERQGVPYGVRLRDVRSVLSLGPVTRVPGAPAWIAGVAALAGRILTVVDVAGTGGDACRARYALVLGAERAELALAADEIGGTIEIDPQDVLRAHALGAGAAPGAVLGRTIEGRILIDPRALVHMRQPEART